MMMGERKREQQNGTSRRTAAASSSASCPELQSTAGRQQQRTRGVADGSSSAVAHQVRAVVRAFQRLLSRSNPLLTFPPYSRRESIFLPVQAPLFQAKKIKRGTAKTHHDPPHPLQSINPTSRQPHPHIGGGGDGGGHSAAPAAAAAAAS